MHFDTAPWKAPFLQITEHGLGAVTSGEFDTAVADLDIAAIEAQTEALFAGYTIREVVAEDTFRGLSLVQAKQAWLEAGPAFWDGVRKLALILNGASVVELAQFDSVVTELNPRLDMLKQLKFNELAYAALVAKITENRA